MSPMVSYEAHGIPSVEAASKDYFVLSSYYSNFMSILLTEYRFVC